MNGLPRRVTLIFDGRCGFCTRSVRLLRILDRDGRVEAVPYQKPGTPQTYGLSLAQCEATLWAITPDRYSGAAAVNAALAVALGTRLPLALYGVPGVGRLQERAYSLVARNRRRLPGDVSFCRRHPEACR